MAFSRCPECGKDLGGIFDSCEKDVNEFVKKETSKKGDIDPSKYELIPDIIPPLKSIFDEYDVVKPCCVSHMIGYLHMKKRPQK